MTLSPGTHLKLQICIDTMTPLLSNFNLRPNTTKLFETAASVCKDWRPDFQGCLFRFDWSMKESKMNFDEIFCFILLYFDLFAKYVCMDLKFKHIDPFESELFNLRNYHFLLISCSQLVQAMPNPDPRPKTIGHDFLLNKTKDNTAPENEILI